MTPGRESNACQCSQGPRRERGTNVTRREVLMLAARTQWPLPLFPVTASLAGILLGAGTLYAKSRPPDLSGACLTRARLERVNLRQACLAGAQLADALL